jgi:hypothetical protein
LTYDDRANILLLMVTIFVPLVSIHHHRKQARHH